MPKRSRKLNSQLDKKRSASPLTVYLSVSWKTSLQLNEIKLRAGSCNKEREEQKLHLHALTWLVAVLQTNNKTGEFCCALTLSVFHSLSWASPYIYIIISASACANNIYINTPTGMPRLAAWALNECTLASAAHGDNDPLLVAVTHLKTQGSARLWAAYKRIVATAECIMFLGAQSTSRFFNGFKGDCWEPGANCFYTVSTCSTVGFHLDNCNYGLSALQLMSDAVCSKLWNIQRTHLQF